MLFVSGRTSTACIHYMPTKLLNTPALRPEQITELNKANRKLAVHMHGRHRAYGYCSIQDYVYVELGRIQPGEEQAVFETFSELKEQANQWVHLFYSLFVFIQLYTDWMLNQTSWKFCQSRWPLFSLTRKQSW